MGSIDDFHKTHPTFNEWMARDESADLSPEFRSIVQERLNETGSADKPRATSRTVLSAVVQRLARSLGVPSEDLAKRIPEDTLRRTKYPVNERMQPDGSILFENPPGIIEGPRGLIHR